MKKFDNPYNLYDKIIIKIFERKLSCEKLYETPSQNPVNKHDIL